MFHTQIFKSPIRPLNIFEKIRFSILIFELTVLTMHVLALIKIKLLENVT